MVERPNDRPGYLDLTGTAFTDHHRMPLQSPGDLAPPKTGEIPPALSPLDAFAFQSRLLARKFEEEQDGKRLSRLPHLTIQNEFARRPGYFRSASSDVSTPFGDSPQDETLNIGTLREAPQDARPLSMYPAFEDGETSSSSPQKPAHKATLPEIGEEETETPPFRTALPIQRPTDYFGVPRAASPEQIETRVERPTPETPSSRIEERLQTSPPANFDALSINSVTSPNQGLRPPRSPLAMKNSPSIRSVYDSSLDDVDAFSMGSIDSLPPRMPSTCSSYSRSHSPAIPFQIPLPRSPSIQSESSWASGPVLNFSRPLSGMGRPSLDRRTTNESALYRQGTMDSTSDRISLDVPSRQDTGDFPLTPMTLASEDSFSGSQDMNASHYTYSKYSLPRGRPLNRESIAPGDFILQQFQWDDELASGRISLSRSPSPNPRRPHTPPYTTPPHLQRRSEDNRTTSSGSPRQRRTLHKANRSNPSQYPDKRSLDYIKSSASSTLTSSDASTIKAQLDSSKPTSILDLTPEQHLQRGIELHEAGSLQKSTYHLRNAAKAGLPTAMLLYALACRHGWGMRASQAEGVAWLQRAVDSAQLECADDEDLVARGAADPSGGPARKTHKAQFALSVYELGMSYMNGWGVRQDRALGLRCFEVAGNWGDADALAEAAFCYAEGHGCKKDLRKAAKLYREAERRGMSMAGNSWIYKEKYMDDNSGSEGRRSRPTTKSGAADRGARDKSRTRGIFSRKKSFAKETAA